jgi:nitrogen fixation protein NifU and related proteins
MSVFDDLYQEIIMDHYRRPRNRANLDHIPYIIAHENPTCGDSLKLEVNFDKDGRLDGVRFDCKGCAISTASASLMSEKIKGLSVAETKELAEKFIHALRGEIAIETLDQMGDLAAFKGVVNLPIRVKCATLAWHALLESLPKSNEEES